MIAAMLAGAAATANAGNEDWLGGYGGIAAAYTNTSTGFSGEEPSGFSGIGILGANLFSANNFVLGVEATAALFGKVDEGRSEAKEAWSAGGRVGYVLGNFMPFVTLSYGRGKGEYNAEDANFSGPLYGIGLESKVIDSINVRAEYVRFQSSDAKVLGRQSIDPDADIFRVGVTRKF
jgi:outer membrane immunogenic protein